MLSRSCLGNRLVRRGSKADEPLNSVTRTCARAHTPPHQEANRDSVHGHWPTGRYCLVTGNGMCLFSGSCTILVIRGSRLSCPLTLHTLKTLMDRRARASRQTQCKGRRRTKELRHKPERTQRDTQINMLSLMFLGDRNSSLPDCLDQEKEKESEWPFHPVMTATGRQQLRKHTNTHTTEVSS